MNVNLIAISVGNTRTQIGTFVDGTLAERTYVANQDPDAIGLTVELEYADIKDKPDAVILMASVNPTLSDRLVQIIKDRLGITVKRVERDMVIPIGRHLDPESIVGEDRLLNAAAAYDAVKQACIIVDAGTAVTVDFVDGTGTFHGGAIGPGARLMLESLNKGTAQLPEIALQRPEEPIGHNTAEAMRSGVFHGLRGMVRELVEQFAEVAGSYPLVIATGGDAEILFGDYELIERIVPQLTLLGMAVTLQAATSAEDDENA